MTTAFPDSSTFLSLLKNLNTLDADDLPPNLDSKTHACETCNSGAATSRCRDCNKYLCDSCVGTHLRMLMTKDHCVLRISDSPGLLFPVFKPEASRRGALLCEKHLEEIKFFCETCCVAICSECATIFHGGHSFVFIRDAINSSRNISENLVSETKVEVETMKHAVELTKTMLEAVNVKAQSALTEVNSIAFKLQSALIERVTTLRNQIETIRNIKTKVLIKQADDLTNAITHCSFANEQLSNSLELGSPMDVIYSKVQALQEVKHLTTKSVRVGFMHPDNDIISLVANDFSKLFKSISSFGDIHSTSFVQFMIGDNLLNTLPRKLSNKSFIEHSFNNVELFTDLPRNGGGVVLPDTLDKHFALYLPFRDNNNVNAPVSNAYLFQSKQIQPYKVADCIVKRRKNNYGSKLCLTFGKEGDGDGEFCRPWGVCCDKEGNIIVADRSNHRIQVFKNDGTFLRKFGRHGNEFGQFDRPAGVAVNPMGNIVVADKDNHRIQIFTCDCKFLFTFGEKGSKNGQFNYPWDVDVNLDGYIIVSDTRNHRIQLFTQDGGFVNKYGYEENAYMYKFFDSPRGVVFMPNSLICITDFNNHRVLVVEMNSKENRYLGVEGSGSYQFVRPQGIAVDSDGHFVVADSRNNRIQIYEQNGNFMRHFGTQGKEPGQFDRPSGVCISPDGKIIVVDFGNNRIQVFE